MCPIDHKLTVDDLKGMWEDTYSDNPKVPVEVFLERVEICQTCDRMVIRDGDMHCVDCKCNLNGEAREIVMKMAPFVESLPKLGCNHRKRGWKRRNKTWGWRR